MIKYLIFVSTLIFLFDVKEIDLSKKQCVIDGMEISLGEKYDDNQPSCTICTCSTDENDPCENITQCSDLDCKRNSLFFKNCCKKLKCLGILLVIIRA